ncbi:MAG TPA: glycosyltransferase family 4 protein [Nitrolancea sp.]|nr:glycosyltransferase family 4 protein [Nitrolancea sp.]
MYDTFQPVQPVQQASAIPLSSAEPRRVCLLSDDLSGPPDEGVKKVTLQLAAALAPHHHVSLLSTTPTSQGSAARYVPAPRTFLSRSLRAELRRLQPDVLIYATRRSATFNSFLRARLLKRYCPTATLVLLALQTRRHPAWQQRLIRHLLPDLAGVQSGANRDYLTGLGCHVTLVRGGVDSAAFQPVDEARRQLLRARYGLRDDLPVVLHVGHLHRERGVGVLAALASGHECQVVLVASSSTPQEADIGDELRAAGVTLLTTYLPHIEELYQLADCYVFPVLSTDAAIELPLSVLEALACDLPVVTTRFGGLPQAFANAPSEGLVFIDSPQELVTEALRLCREDSGSTRPLALPFAWEAVAADLLAQALAIRGEPNGRAVEIEGLSQGETPWAGEVSHAGQ